MNEFKLAHTADTHLRDTQMGIRLRGQDFTDALIDVIESCEKHKVDVIMHSGDLLDTMRPSSRTIDDLKKIEQMLVDRNLLMLVVRGNHDFTDPPWHETVSLGIEGVGIKCLDFKSHVLTKGDSKLTIAGLPFLQKQDFLERLKGIEADVLMWHGMVADFVEYPVQETVALSDINPNQFKLIALGDVHKKQTIMHGSCVAAYPGSTELCDRGEDPVKTFNIYHIDDPIIRAEEVDIKTRPVMCFHVGGDDEVAEVTSKVNARIDEHPMVLVSYSPDYPDIPKRLRAGINMDKCIFRASQKRVNKGGPRVDKIESNSRLSMLDFLPNFIPAGGDLFTLGQQLLDPKAEARVIIDTYVEEFMNK